MFSCSDVWDVALVFIALAVAAVVHFDAWLALLELVPVVCECLMGCVIVEPVCYGLLSKVFGLDDTIDGIGFMPYVSGIEQSSGYHSLGALFAGCLPLGPLIYCAFSHDLDPLY